MKRRFWSIGTVVVAVITTGFTPQVHAPREGPANCYSCADCFLEPGGAGHSSYLDGEGTKGGGTHNCVALPGCPHAACQNALNTEADSSAYYEVIHLANEAVEGNPAALSQLASGKYDRVRFNDARNSLQIEGCEKGTYIANIPLDGHTLATTLPAAERRNNRS